MATRNDKVNAGLFLVLSFLLVVSLLILVTGWQIKGERVIYYCIFNSSIGSLQDGAGVRYMGVPVGKVTDIQFAQGDPGRIRVTLDLDKDRSPIRTNTYATLQVQIISNLTHVELKVPANEKAPPLPPGNEIPVKMTELEVVLSNAESMSKNFASVLERLSVALDEDTLDDIKSILGSINESSVAVSQVLRQRTLDDLMHGLDEATRSVNAASVDISRTMADLRRLTEAIRNDPSRLLWSQPLPPQEYSSGED
jgi:phospholipid/cholesterol/gamma-HCH transport system substrate-binding protein